MKGSADIHVVLIVTVIITWIVIGWIALHFIIKFW